LAKEFPKAKIYATDISQDALKVARINAKKHHVKIKFLHGDLLKPLKEKVDIIVANLPYIANHYHIKNIEPKKALYGGKDGLDLIERLLEQAPKYLNRKGRILLEIDPRQKIKLQKLINQLPYQKYFFKKDLSNRNRILILHS
jgi:release factor glutamine methyltransferase